MVNDGDSSPPQSAGGVLAVHPRGKGLPALLAVVTGATLLQRFLPREEDPARWAFQATPRRLPEINFSDGLGAPTTLDRFRGNVVLLNIWATWCPPCRREMPSLDRLQQRLVAEGSEVVALSIDTGGDGLRAIKSFYTSIAVRIRRIYNDADGTAGVRLGALGVPTTSLLDRAGREVARTSGPVDWDSAQAVDFIRGHIAR